MISEKRNPMRRYEWFRPRQGARALRVQPTPVNKATIQIQNNSLGPELLVIRDLELVATAADTVQTSFQPAIAGTTAGTVSPMIFGDATPAGAISGIDTATVFAGDFAMGINSTGLWQWFHEWPFAVLQPGACLILQNTVTAHALTCSAVWERIAPEELDFWG